MPAPIADIRNNVSACSAWLKHFGEVPDSKPISKVRREQLNHCLSAAREHDSTNSHKWLIALSGEDISPVTSIRAN